MLQQIRYVVVLLLGAVLMLFTIQNMARVDLKFLLWTFESRRIVVIALSFAIGFAIGWVVRAMRARRHE